MICLPNLSPNNDAKASEIPIISIPNWNAKIFLGTKNVAQRMTPRGRKTSPNVLRSTECMEEKIFLRRVTKSKTAKIAAIIIISSLFKKNGNAKTINDDMMWAIFLLKEDGMENFLDKISFRIKQESINITNKINASMFILKIQKLHIA